MKRSLGHAGLLLGAGAVGLLVGLGSAEAARGTAPASIPLDLTIPAFVVVLGLAAVLAFGLDSGAERASRWVWPAAAVTVAGAAALGWLVYVVPTSG